jgi:nicotinate phosphoribosyltransferase
LKALYRVYDGQTKKALADLIALEEEKYDTAQPLNLFDPENTWKTMTVTDYILRPLLVPVFTAGELVYKSPNLLEIQAYAAKEMDSFWGEYRRLQSPHRYKVDLSKPLYDLKQKLLSLKSKNA